jgi:hypothetical protein
MTSGDRSLSDEMLSAYLDGMLDESGVRTLEAALERDPSVGRRLAEMARNDRALRQHFQAMGRRPVPRSISDLLESAPARTHSWWSGIVQGLSAWRPLSSPLKAAGALAMVAVVGIGVVAMLQTGQGGVSEDNVLVQVLPSNSAEVSRVLDGQPSGEGIALDGVGRLVVDMSFEHSDGRFCRQYRAGLDRESSSLGVVACRVGRDWREVLIQQIEAPIGESGMFRAASGQASSVLDDYIVEKAAGGIIVGDSEAELIERNWSRP